MSGRTRVQTRLRFASAYASAKTVRVTNLVTNRVVAIRHPQAVQSILAWDDTDVIWDGRTITLPHPIDVMWVIEFDAPSPKRVKVSVKGGVAYVEPFVANTVHPEVYPFRVSESVVIASILKIKQLIGVQDYPQLADETDPRWEKCVIYPTPASGVRVRCIPSTANNDPIDTLYAPVSGWTIREDGRRWMQIKRGALAPGWISTDWTGATTDDALLNVEWVSQLDANAPGAFDCGQACVLMLLRHLMPQVGSRLTVKTLTDVRAGRTGADTLVALASTFGLRFTSARTPRADIVATLRKQVDAKMPTIALVYYWDLGVKNDHAPRTGRDPGQHWVVVTGYAGDTFFVHDPLWNLEDRGGHGGASVPVSATALTTAYRGYIVHGVMP